MEALLSTLPEVEGFMRATEDQERLKKHAWDPKDKSTNIDLSENNQTARHSEKKGTSDAVRGSVGYKSGVFMFEFEWQARTTDTHLVLGVATAQAPLSGPERTALIGGNEFSVGWDVTHGHILFNGCKMERYPRRSGGVPSRVTMVLDMTAGTLAFRSGTTDFGVAKRGLCHMAPCLYVAASMDAPGDSVKMTYLGSFDGVRNALKRNLQGSSGSRLRFHDKCGRNLRLSNDNSTAERKDCGEAGWATAVTARALRDGELFSVRCDTRDRQARHGWMYGALSVPPEQLQLGVSVTQLEQGTRWVYRGCQILQQDKTLHELNVDIDDLKTGDRVALRRQGDVLQFLVNGDRVARVPLPAQQQLYGFVDVYGKTIKVTLTGESEGGRVLTSESMRNLLTALLPTITANLAAQVPPLVEKLRERHPDKIGRVRARVKVTILEPYASRSNSQRREAAETLADIPDGARALTQYLQFLYDTGLNTSDDVFKAYMHLVSTTVNFTHHSRRLCLQLGESGLLKRLIEEIYFLQTLDSTKHKSYEFLSSYVLILSNAGRIEENAPIYQESNFVEIAKIFVPAYEDKANLSLCMLFTMSYICTEDQLSCLDAPDKCLSNLVGILHEASKTRSSDGCYEYAGWECWELTSGISSLSRYKPNISKLINYGVLEPLYNVLTVNDTNEIECGLNAVCSLVTPETRLTVLESPGMLDRLRGLASSTEEVVAQGAVRVLAHLNITRSARSFCAGTEDATEATERDAAGSHADTCTSESIADPSLTPHVEVALKSADARDNGEEDRSPRVSVASHSETPKTSAVEASSAVEPSKFDTRIDIITAEEPLKADARTDTIHSKEPVKSDTGADTIPSHEPVKADPGVDTTPNIEPLKPYAGDETTPSKEPLKSDARKTDTTPVKEAVDTGGRNTYKEAVSSPVTKPDSHADRTEKRPGSDKGERSGSTRPNTTVEEVINPHDRNQANYNILIEDLQPTPRVCQHKAISDRFKRSLMLAVEFFDPTDEECFCAECHGLSGKETHYKCGKPPKKYAIPVGWCKYGLYLPPRASALRVQETWHRAYHGTKSDHIPGILNVGEIVPAGRPVLGHKTIKEGSGHFKEGYKPRGFDTKQVFLSPSIRYAGVDSYAKPTIYMDLEFGRFISKVALQVMISPGSYNVGPQTIGAHRQIDPGFSNQELEWSTNQHGSTILVALLVSVKAEDER